MQIEAKGHSGTVTFDGQSVIITRESFLARATVGKGRKSIPLDSITAVQWKAAGALVNGYIQFTIPGGNEGRSRMGSATIDAGRDENAVVFTRKQMPDFEALRTAVEQAIATRGNAAAAPVQLSAADRIQQLAGLRDQGLITEAEYETKRGELLAAL
jgi:hypothetical protein